MEKFTVWLRAHGWTLLVLLFLPLAGMALFPFAHSLLSSGKTPPVAFNDDAQLLLFVTGGCGLLLTGFLLLAHSRNRIAGLRQESVERSLEYQKLITEATRGLYESIYEVDVTRDRADSEETRHYFERLGIPGDTPFSEALRHIAAKQVREEDRRGYLETFSPDKVLRAYREGVRSLRYELMISGDGENYYWLRIMARIFMLPCDQSVRMIVYRQNIDAEKRHWRIYQHQQLIMEATKGLYENIYELDVTNNRAGSEETRRYFERLGIPGDTPFDEALRHIAAKQIREEDRRGYLTTFSPENVLRVYREGVRSLHCDFMISTDGKSYYWLRIMARIFVLPHDQSVRMIIYRQNIDAEKRHQKMYQYQQMVMEAAKGLYENIYEMDMTHNCAANEETRAYFESLGLSGDAPYDSFLRHVAETQIKAGHRQRYLDAFLPDRVLEAYARGTDSLNCEIMMSTRDNGYRWLRITVRVFFWEEDNSVRIFSFRQNIDEEKKRESLLAAQARLDPLTGLCNKTATEGLIGETLASGGAGELMHAFFILDIDNFKLVNDDFGHAAGDAILREFVRELKRQFRDKDIVGRIGGDEFVAFLPVPDRAWVEKKARGLSAALRKSFTSETGTSETGAFGISASIGIALSPGDGTDFAALYRNADAALYQTKRRGKNGFTIHAGA